MWDKIGKIALQAGKIYVEKRGVDGVIEDANKVFNAAKKGAQSVGNMFTSNTEYSEEIEIDQEEDLQTTLDYEALDEHINVILPVMKEDLRKVKGLNILSEEYNQLVQRSLCMGYDFISKCINLEDEISESDFDFLLENYISPVDSICDELLILTGAKCVSNRTTPVSKAEYESPFSMEVHGVLPVNYNSSNTLLIGEIKTGKISKGDLIILDKENNLTGEIAYIKMFGKILGEAEAGDICGISILGDFLYDLPNEVFIVGKVGDDIETTEERAFSNKEIEYMDELKACLADDGEISEKERRLLNKLRINLGISEERAKELEDQCSPSVFSEEETEYIEELRACIADDGIISDRERRLLDKLRKSLGISEERAKEIEKQIGI